jgi:hypothetical protein
MKNIFRVLGSLCLLNVLTQYASADPEPGFTSLFDGKTLNGWTLVGKKGDGYGVSNGVIYSLFVCFVLLFSPPTSSAD